MLNLHGLLFRADEAQKQIIRVSDIPQPSIRGIIRVTGGESSALLDESFDFGSMPFLILQSPEAVADALVGGVIPSLFPMRVGRDKCARDVLIQLVQVDI